MWSLLWVVQAATLQPGQLRLLVPKWRVLRQLQITSSRGHCRDFFWRLVWLSSCVLFPLLLCLQFHMEQTVSCWLAWRSDSYIASQENDSLKFCFPVSSVTNKLLRSGELVIVWKLGGQMAHFTVTHVEPVTYLSDSHAVCCYFGWESRSWCWCQVLIDMEWKEC